MADEIGTERRGCGVEPTDNDLALDGKSELKVVKSSRKGQMRDKAALQVIILGSGGGPLENNTTAFLVRSIEVGWRRGSVLAVDAGVHLGAISKILQPYVDSVQRDTDVRPDSASSSEASSIVYTLNEGPFKGFELSHRTADANAAHITRDMIDTYLITHPHLDHISGMIVGTASLGSSNRAKRIAGLPSTIEAFKQHIFNNVIWPNLSDENGGPGLINYLKLTDGGSVALGSGEHAGYFEVTEGLSVRTRSVSHGHCLEQHTHRGSGSDIHSFGRTSHDQQQQSVSSPVPYGVPSRLSQGVPSFVHQPLLSHDLEPGQCVIDSSTYFIRDIATRREVLIWGDVEPDSISLHPRNRQVWEDAAPLVAAGRLKVILIECSYTDDRQDDLLFGHLCPRHLIAELLVLAHCVKNVELVPEETESSGRKRKFRSKDDSYGKDPIAARRRAAASSSQGGLSQRPGIKRAASSGVSPRSGHIFRGRDMSGLSTEYFDEPITPVTLGPSRIFLPTIPSASPTFYMPDEYESDTPAEDVSREMPRSSMKSYAAQQASESQVSTPTSISITRTKVLAGLRIVIIHVKERLDDEPLCGDVILQELQEHDEVAQLGCEFVISYPGMSIEL